MGTDLGTLCLIGFVIIIGLIVLMTLFRNNNRGGTPPGGYSDEGYTPEYDDPDVQSRGGFGRNRGGIGGFGGSRSSNKSGSPSNGGANSGNKGSSSSGGSSSRRNDSPDVQSRGGFGRNRK